MNKSLSRGKQKISCRDRTEVKAQICGSKPQGFGKVVTYAER